MDTKFTCPHCPQMLVVDSAGAGQWINCPNCKTSIQIPQLPPVHSEPEQPDRQKPQINLGRCDACDGVISLRAYTCPHCGDPKQSLIHILKETNPRKPRLGRCDACNGFMSLQAYACPHCGDQKQSPIHTLFFIVAIVYLILGGLSILAILGFLSRIPIR